MLKNLKEILGFKILAKDSGEHSFGKVRDVYFEKEEIKEVWVLRYLEIDTGNWLSKNLILISPYSVLHVDWVESVVWINLTKEQIEASPKAEMNQPISRKYEVLYNNHYNLPHYWSSGLGIEIDGFWAGSNLPIGIENWLGEHPQTYQEQTLIDPNLYSMKDLFDFHLQALNDKKIGIIEDLIFEEKTWAIRYLIVDPTRFWPEKNKLLISTSWIEQIDNEKRELKTDIPIELIQSAPTYNPAVGIDRILEIEIFSHYKKPDYWNDRKIQDHYEDNSMHLK